MRPCKQGKSTVLLKYKTVPRPKNNFKADEANSMPARGLFFAQNIGPDKSRRRRLNWKLQLLEKQRRMSNKLAGLLLLNTRGEVRLHARFKNKLWSQQRRACIATTSQPNNQLWFTARALWWLFNNSPVNTYLYINLQYGTTADLGNVFLQENHLSVLVSWSDSFTNSSRVLPTSRVVYHFLYNNQKKSARSDWSIRCGLLLL